jgi:hypothetical protein
MKEEKQVRCVRMCEVKCCHLDGNKFRKTQGKLENGSEKEKKPFPKEVRQTKVISLVSPILVTHHLNYDTTIPMWSAYVRYLDNVQVIAIEEADTMSCVEH